MSYQRRRGEPVPNPLPHTTEVVQMLREGKREQAISHHNATVKRVMAEAEKGRTVNITDLLAGKETLAIDALAGGQ